MKVLLLEARKLVGSKDMGAVYNNIVMQIRTNAIAMIPDCIAAYGVVDIDAVAYVNDGLIHFRPLEAKGETNV